MKTQSLFVGRFQPPTIKHTELIEQMFKQQNTDLIVIGIVQGEKSSQKILENPFPQNLRQIMIDKICKKFSVKYNKEYKIIIVKNGYIPDIIEELKKDDINVVSFFCGQDRKTSYEQMLQRQNISLNIIVFDRQLESDENISQTKVRKQLLKNDLETQKKLTPPEIHDILPELQEYFQEIVKDISPKQLNKFLTEIKHIDEIPIENFINYIKNLLYNTEPMLQSVKIDGIQNITFGYNNGEIYCQRRKGKIQKWENVEDVPKIPQYNQIRSQFNFMKHWYELNKELFLDQIKDFKNEQFEFEFEILSSIYSNLIKYNTDKSKLIYLRPLPKFSSGNVDFQKLDDVLLKLFKKTKRESYNVTTINYIPELNENGEVELKEKPIDEIWSFDVVEYIDVQKYISLQKDEIENKLKELEEFLKSPVGDYITDIDEKYKILTVFEVLVVKLNKVKKEDRETIKSLKNILSKIQNEYVINIKKLLLQYINDKVSEEKQSEIEGIVLRKLGVSEDELVKLVDKETFSQINKYVHLFYEELLDEISELNSQIIDILNLSNIDKSNITIDTLLQQINLSSKNITEIHKLLNKIISLCVSQIKKVQESPDIIEINSKQINITHLKDKIVKQILYQQYLVQEVLKSSNDLFIKKLLQYLFRLNQDDNQDENITDNKQIIEGGNQFDDVEKLHFTEVDLQIEELYNYFLKKIKLEKTDFIILGSVKKKEFSGDLDIGISIDQLKKIYKFNTIDEQLNIFEQLCIKYFKDVKRFNTLISIKFTFNTVNESGNLVPKTIQVDFILGNLNYLKDYFYSQYSPEMLLKLDTKDLESVEVSQYKSVYRNVLLQNILTHQFSEIIEDSDFEYKYQFTITPQGIWKNIKQRKKGNKTWKPLEKELIDDKDLQETLSKIFGIKVSFKDISTFEKLLDFMFNKLTLPPEQINSIFKDFREFCEKNGYVYPENLIDEYLKKIS